MEIGGNIDYHIQAFLIKLAQLSGYVAGSRVSVDDINESLNFSRIQIKDILDYATSVGYAQPETIGGKWLYGHVSITEKGLSIVDKWEKSNKTSL